MVEISGRYIKIILYLLEQKYPVPASKISKEIGVNINTLRKDIPRFNDFLKESGLSIIAKPKVGFEIAGPHEKIESLKEKLTFLENKLLDRKGKIWYMIEIFLSREKIPTIEDFCELLEISRPTAVEYVHEAREWLSKERIEVFGKSGCGYYLKGEEEDIRNALVDSIKNFLGFELQTVALEVTQGTLKHNVFGVLENPNLAGIRKFLDEVQTHLKKRFVDEDLLSLAISIALSIKRIEKGHIITYETEKVDEILHNPISLVIKSNISVIENEFHVRFTDSEISHLALKFIGAKTRNIGDAESFVIASKFRKIAEEMASLTDDLLGLPINKEDEFISMLAHHLESTITKIKIGVKIENPALEIVKKEYPVAYTVAERASKIVKDRFHLEIPDEETGYIATYIAASLEKLKKSSRKKVFIVCPMGLATSKLLYYRLINEIPEVDVVSVGSFEDIDANPPDNNVDLIISTTRLPNAKIPYVIVSPFLSIGDKKLIKEILKIEKSESYASSQGETFNERLTFSRIEASTVTEVIKLLANAVVENGYSKRGLEDEVIARETKYPTGIATEIPIAIPHAGPDFAIKKGFAIATLKDPVKFYDMGDPKRVLDVRIVIMPVLTGKEEEGREFYELIQKLRDYKAANELLQCCSPQAIGEVLRK